MLPPLVRRSISRAFVIRVFSLFLMWDSRDGTCGPCEVPEDVGNCPRSVKMNAKHLDEDLRLEDRAWSLELGAWSLELGAWSGDRRPETGDRSYALRFFLKAWIIRL